MKKIHLIGLAAVMMVFAITGISQATPIAIAAGDFIQLTGYNSLDNAGVMTYNVYNPTGTLIGSLDTFCIQDNVYIDFGMNKIESLTNYVGIDGKTSWTTSGNVVQSQNPQNIPGTGPLNGAVDYLFYRFASGAYTNSMINDELEADLQKVLWTLQGSGPTYNYSTFNNLWEQDLTTYLNTESMRQRSYGTEVINIVSANGVNLQNQLYNPMNPVPEPATLLLMGTGLAGLAGLRRRKKA